MNAAARLILTLTRDIILQEMAACGMKMVFTVLMMTAMLGIPVSTTHVISGAIMGVGAVENAARVRWITARRIVWAWIVTIPVAGVIAAAAFWALRLLPL